MAKLVRVAVLAALLVGSSLARAQTNENKVAAEALFDDGRKLMTEGRYADACAKFEQSQRFDPGIGTLLYLADCYEKSGRIASAWATFREGASQAKAAGQTDRAQAGEERARSLEPRLSKLSIKVSQETQALPGLTVARAGTAITKGIWGVAVPIDGGEYLIEAKAPGHEPWSGRVTVAAEKDDAKIEVPALLATSEVPPPPAAEPPPTSPVSSPPRPPARDTEPEGTGQRTVGVILGGVGVVGVGFGTYFGLRAVSKNNDAKKLCDGAVCHDRKGETLTDDAQEAATVSNLAFGIGLVALSTGVVLYLSAPSSRRATALSITPLAARRGGGLSLGGLF